MKRNEAFETAVVIMRVVNIGMGWLICASLFLLMLQGQQP